MQIYSNAEMTTYIASVVDTISEVGCTDDMTSRQAKDTEYTRQVHETHIKYLIAISRLGVAAQSWPAVAFPPLTTVPFNQLTLAPYPVAVTFTLA